MAPIGFCRNSHLAFLVAYICESQAKEQDITMERWEAAHANVMKAVSAPGINVRSGSQMLLSSNADPEKNPATTKLRTCLEKANFEDIDWGKFESWYLKIIEEAKEAGIPILNVQFKIAEVRLYY